MLLRAQIKKYQEEKLHKITFCIQLKVCIMIGMVWFGFGFGFLVLVHFSLRLHLPSEWIFDMGGVYVG